MSTPDTIRTPQPTTTPKKANGRRRPTVDELRQRELPTDRLWTIEDVAAFLQCCVREAEDIVKEPAPAVPGPAATLVTHPLAQLAGRRRRAARPQLRRRRRRRRAGTGGSVMSDPKTVVTCHGGTVTFYLSPRDVNPSEVTVAKPKHARRTADTIRAVRAERQLTGNSPMYAALALWAWTGTSKLSDKSWGKYRPQVVRAMQETGSTGWRPVWWWK